MITEQKERATEKVVKVKKNDKSKCNQSYQRGT